MSDKTLEDLILTEDAPQEGKSKSLLALLALVVILIIVGAVLAKMIFSDSSDDNKSVKVKESSEISVKDTTKVDSISKDINADLEPIKDADLTPIKDNNEMPSNVDTINIDESKTEAKNSKNIKNTTNTKEKEIANDLEVSPIKEVKVKEKAKSKIEVKEHKNRPKVTHKEHKKHIYGGKGNVYIQVGSFAKGPEQSFINKIRRAGFKFRIKTTNGLRRVYVGPFENRSQASEVLGIVKSKIAPQAFIK